MLPQAFAPLLAGCFARLLALWRQSEPPLLAQAWLARAHPVGTAVTVHASADETVSGRFDGIELDGALRLRRDDGSLDIIRAGDVEL
jgi:BirA family transcriptional regulator, biotin operon repressor / biotin---[acetyl-CoA-carboxylase] ligase